MNPNWWPLHLRAARGEDLTPDERAIYEAARKRIEEGESYPGDLVSLKQTRAQIMDLEAEQAALQARHDALKAEIDALESALDERTRQALGLAVATERE